MRVFQLISSETDTFCGETLVHAIKAYLDLTGLSFWEFSDTDEIKEVPKDEWAEFFFEDEDLGKISLEQYMSSAHVEATLICSTAY